MNQLKTLDLEELEPIETDTVNGVERDIYNQLLWVQITEKNEQ